MLYDTATGRRGPVLWRGTRAKSTYLEDSPDGRRLAVAAKDGTILICEAATGHQQLVLRGEKPASVRFCRDGRRIISNEAAIATGNGKYRLWDTTTGRQLAVLGEGKFTAYNSGTTFTPDGKRVATADGEVIRFNDAETGQQLFASAPLGSPVDRVFFSPNGKRIIADQAFLCDGDTGLRIAALGEPKSADWYFAFSATARGWRPPPNTLRTLFDSGREHRQTDPRHGRSYQRRDGPGIQP